MSDSGTAPASPFPNTRYYDDLVHRWSHLRLSRPQRGHPGHPVLHLGDDGTAKGRLLHPQANSAAHPGHSASGLGDSAMRLNSADVWMPLVPFFHVHGWGLPYLAGMWGMKTVLVGRYDAKNILDLMQREKVTFSDMVPTILNMVINHPQAAEYGEALSHGGGS